MYIHIYVCVHVYMYVFTYIYIYVGLAVGWGGASVGSSLAAHKGRFETATSRAAVFDACGPTP